MNRCFPILFLSASLVILGGCSKGASELKGNWAVDLAPMVDRAKAAGASESELAKIKENFDGGRMTIDDHDIRFSVVGVSVDAAFEYTVLSKEGSCYDVSTKMSATPAKYCLVDGELEVHDSNMGEVLYKRQ